MANLFGFLAEVVEIDNNTNEILKLVKEAAALEILVGIPDDASGRQDHSTAAATNAELLFIHTNGSPINGIPARPVIEPALEHDREQVGTLLQKVADGALSGSKDRMLAAAEKAGQQGANLARAWFTNPANGWAANDEATIKAKGSDRPLIDTGEMRKSITYKVE